MTRLSRLMAAALAAGSLAALPVRPATAQTTHDSQMQTQCTGYSCIFTLYVTPLNPLLPTASFDFFRVDISGPTGRFAAFPINPFLADTDMGTTFLTPNVLNSGRTLELSFSGPASANSFMTFTADMATPINSQLLAYTYQGSGDHTSVSGTVTPEPATMLLLGTGLSGLAGAARRRRRQTLEA